MQFSPPPPFLVRHVRDEAAFPPSNMFIGDISKDESPNRPSSLAEAQTLSEYALIMEADYGGQIYATCPVRLIRCDDACLRQLLDDIESIRWNAFVGYEYYFEFAPVGSSISGGMGGGKILNSVWCHEEIYEISMAAAIADVIEGRAKRLDIPSSKFLELQARKGDKSAQYFLAERFRQSHPLMALKWYRAAGGQRHLSALNTLSCERKITDEERIYWLEVLAQLSGDDLRIVWARFRLAYVLDAGKEVARDLITAARLYKEVCNSRYSARCALRLGELYFYGDGVTKNLQHAFMWLLLGSAASVDEWPNWMAVAPPTLREESENLRHEIEKLLTPGEVAEATRMAQQYFANGDWSERNAK